MQLQGAGPGSLWTLLLLQLCTEMGMYSNPLPTSLLALFILCWGSVCAQDCPQGSMLAAWLRPRAKRCQLWRGRHCQQHSSQQCCHLHHPALHPALLSACRRWGSHCAAFWGCHWKDAVALRLMGWCLSCAPPRAMFDSCKYKPGIDICTPHHVSWHPPHLHGMPIQHHI